MIVGTAGSGARDFMTGFLQGRSSLQVCATWQRPPFLYSLGWERLRYQGPAQLS